MRVRHTGYEVPGWGSGDLWTSDDAVLAHEFAFREAALGALAAPLAGPFAASRQGAASPPTGTVPAGGSRMAHGFVSDSRQPPPQPQPPLRGAASVAPDDLVQRFAAFLGGADVDFSDVPLDLDGLTPFQVAVARSLRAIPRGTVVSYAELAVLAGFPRAQRAVGTFCAGNRFAFLLPCHRVVGADGIGGYGSAGVAVKRRLLLLEGVNL